MSTQWRWMWGGVLGVVLLAQTTFATEWPAIAARVKQSVVQVAIGSVAGCSGFVIDNDRDLVLTAAHCDNPAKSGEDLFVDTMPARVRAKDAKNDLMVLYVEGLDRPVLALAKTNPVVGEELASYGYGLSLEDPLFRVTHVSARDISVDRARFLVVDAAFVPGQSGGPVVNAAGDVGLIVQRGNDVMGMGVGAETIADRMGRYFPKR